MTSNYTGERKFGAVFNSQQRGGPKKIIWNDLIGDALNDSGLKWEDRRRPGNTNANESAQSIMKDWTEDRMKRFDVFMTSMYSDLTPWKLAYMDKTAPKWRDQTKSIIKCRLELIKRLLIIKVTGPSSLEDWILLFMFYENELDIPITVVDLLKGQELTPLHYVQKEVPLPEYDSHIVVAPRDFKTRSLFSNPPMPGFAERWNGSFEDVPFYRRAIWRDRAGYMNRHPGSALLIRRNEHFPHGVSPDSHIDDAAMGIHYAPRNLQATRPNLLEERRRR